MFSDEPTRSVGEVVDPAKYVSHPYEQQRCRLIAEQIPAGQGRPALDAGSGPGVFSRILKDRGWRVDAIDAEAENLQHVRDVVENAYQGDVVDTLAERPAGRYDFALALELIEHIPPLRGRALLRELRRVLSPRGRLLLSTPNRHSPEGLIGYYLNEKLRGVRRWGAWDPSHVHIYSSREILALLQREGFIVEAVTGYWYEARLPLLGRFALPFTVCRRRPMNRLGFNLILQCRAKRH
ncbi:MAG: class I SAM-dependent methyltransferase [Phycisphaerae bacterium]|nr:class I SAM-dependent methyltransferase [Phycisphaerae bacterium]